jgi:hypothetical protein
MRVLGLFMSKRRWLSPTPAEIKRAIQAHLDLGLTVTSVRVDEHGVTVSTQPPTGIDAPRTDNGPLEL